MMVSGGAILKEIYFSRCPITEKLYDGFLNPTHAEAQLSLRVLTEGELNSLTFSLGRLAKTAYRYTQDLRQDLALDKIANAADAIIGMFPV